MTMVALYTYDVSYALRLVPLGSVHWKEEMAVEPHMEEQLVLGLTPLRAVGTAVPVDLVYMSVGNR